MYIIVLSSEPQVKADAFLAGANQFVSKGDPPEVFLDALYAICENPSIIIELKKRKQGKIPSRKIDKILL
jgi:hypothetical protein